MKRSPRFARFAVAAALVGVTGAAIGVVACSSDDSNGNTPIIPFDSGVAPDVTTTIPPTGDSSTGPGADTSVPGIDSALPDAGSCVSDAAVMYEAQLCNSCYTPAQDPLNGCSPATVNCTPFDNSRVPSGAP